MKKIIMLSLIAGTMHNFCQSSITTAQATEKLKIAGTIAATAAIGCGQGVIVGKLGTDAKNIFRTGETIKGLLAFGVTALTAIGLKLSSTQVITQAAGQEYVKYNDGAAVATVAYLCLKEMRS